jgi:hypothetical protein
MIAIGDAVEKSLRLVGITKERVAASTGRKHCGCAERQEAMNQFGYRWQAALFNAFRRFRYSRFIMRLVLASRYIRMAARVLLYGS